MSDEIRSAWRARSHQALDIEEFDLRILRGRPTLAPRLEAVPVRMPLPHAEHEGSIFENQRPSHGRSFGPAQTAG